MGVSFVLNVTAGEACSVIRCHSAHCYIANLSYISTVDYKVFCMLQIPWAHLDIAGAAWDHKAHHATGFGAQTLAEWAISQGQ